MKTNVTTSTRRLLALAAAVLGLATLGASHARAQAMLTFVGGNGTPLRLTLNAPVTYAVTTAADAPGDSPLFDFQGVGNPFGGGTSTVSGTITYTINGGAAQTLNYLSSGANQSSLASTDTFVFGAYPGVAVGDTVVLTAGTLTTTANVAGATPVSRSYPTFIIDGRGNKLDAANGVAGPVPEPSAWALLGMGAGALAIAALRRRVRRAA